MDGMKTLAIVIGISLAMVMGLFIFPNIIFLFPVAFIVIGVKYNISNSFISILLTSLLIGFTIDMISGVIMLAVFGSMSLFIAESIDKRRKPIEIIIPSALIFFISYGMVFLMLRGFSGISLLDQLEEAIIAVSDMQLSMIEDVNLTDIESFRLRDSASNLYNYFVSILPALLIIVSLITSYVNYYLSIVVLRRSGLAIRDNPRFSRFRLPNNFIFGSLLMFLVVYLLSGIDGVPTDTIRYNLIFLIGALLLIQGLSVVDFLLVRKNIHIILRIIIIGMILFAPPLITLLFIIGIIDLLFDFRKLRKYKT